MNSRKVTGRYLCNLIKKKFSKPGLIFGLQCLRFKSSNMNSRPKVVIDTDPGTDDAMALLMAFEAHKRKSIEVVGITTVTGNTSLANCNINVLRLLELANLEIPVFSGASRGLVSKYEQKGLPFHGKDGFGDRIKEPPSNYLSKIETEAASLALVRLAKEHEGELILVALGPLTNIAVALNICPELTSFLKDFYIMGGNLNGRGNTSLTSEFNFFCDPEAAKVVLERTNIAIKLTPWDTCLNSLHITYDERFVLGEIKSPSAKFLNTIEGHVVDSRRYNHWINCDQLAMAWMLHNHGRVQLVTADIYKEKLITDTDMFYATVEIMGTLCRGQMVIDKKNPKTNVICMMNIDKELYMEYLKLAFL